MEKKIKIAGQPKIDLKQFGEGNKREGWWRTDSLVVWWEEGAGACLVRARRD